MRELSVDVAIIGAGTAGLNARREVESCGKEWVLIEGGPFGTTCARVGCMPSKLLIAAADAAHEIRHAGQFGVDVSDDGWSVDGPAVMDRVRRERDRFAGFVVAANEQLPQDQVLRGYARFVEPTTLEVAGIDGHDDARVHAKSIVIATGSYPWIPPNLDPIRDRVMVNDDVFELQDLPESMAIFGTGVIALELGQALHRLGVRVSFFNPFDSAGPVSDPAVAAKVKAVLGAELDLHLAADVHTCEPLDDGGVRLAWRDADGTEGQATFATVLSAAGRRANVGNLNLEATGLHLHSNGIPVVDDRTMQAGQSPIFVAGDVVGHRPLLHEAADEGRIAGSNAARFPRVSAGLRRTPLAIAFTDPQMAIVGDGFRALDPKHIEIGEVSYDDQGRSRVMGKNSGLVRIYADRRTCRLIGAEMFGPRVEHTAHLLAWAVQQGIRAQDSLEFPIYHPVVEEGIRTALRDLATKLRVSGNCPPQDRADGPGQ
jgi:dihydrolipoamide dehydrogenase